MLGLPGQAAAKVRPLKSFIEAREV